MRKLSISFLFLMSSSFAFRAGVVSEPLWIPIGVPTAGYAQVRKGDDPGSPFARKFPATRGLHTPISAKVLYLDNGEKALTLIRLDTIGIELPIYRRLKEKMDKQLEKRARDHVLILSATHTHAGPGRLGRNPVWWLAADTYSEWLMQTVEQQILSAWEKARASSFEAKMGFGKVEISEIIGDRRCENPEDKEAMARLWRIDDVQGKVRAVLINFNLHGTVLGAANHFLSVDAPGLIEQKVEENYPHRVIALFVQAAAGDISPHSPINYGNDWDNMEEIGQTAAEKIVPAVANIQTSARLSLKHITVHLPLSREALGYKENEFPYPYGAMLCGLGKEHCDNDFQTPIEEMKRCLLSRKKYMIPETILTAVKLNDWLILTLPGEPTTPLWRKLSQQVEESLGSKKVMLFGYSQDHLGYLLLSWDWWQGGYEPSMSPWGPKLGEYLLDHSLSLAEHLIADQPLSSFPEIEPRVFPGKTAHAPRPEKALDAGTLAQKIKNFEKEKKLVFAWYGGDPSVDLPEVVVEVKQNGKWQPFAPLIDRRPITEKHYSTFLELNVSPNYREQSKARARHFKWVFTWRYKRPVFSPAIALPGAYRFKVKGKAFDGQKVKEYTITSEALKLS